MEILKKIWLENVELIFCSQRERVRFNSKITDSMDLVNFIVSEDRGRGKRRTYFFSMTFSFFKGWEIGIAFFSGLAISMIWILNIAFNNNTPSSLCR